MPEPINGTNMSKTYPITCYPYKISSRGIYGGDFPFDFSVPLLLFQVTLLLIITNTVRFVLKPLKQPAIVCDVIGGLLVGPSGLGRNKKFADTVFPRRSLNELSVGAMIGATYCLFLMGVKQDAMVVLNSGRKSWLFAGLSTIFPLIFMTCSFVVAAAVTKTVRPGMVPEVVISMGSLTAFPSLHPILLELNLLNSKLGRLSMSAATNIDIVGFFLMVLFGAMNQGTSNNKIYFYGISVVGLSIFIVFVIRPLMFWVIHQTPEARPVSRSYIIFILLGVLVIAFIADFVGMLSMNASWMLGLAMPDGPPLGAALVEKSETIIGSFFLPIFYAFIGLKTNVYAIRDWKAWGTLQVVLILGYIAKVVAAMLASRRIKMPLYDALSLGFIMNFKGLIEFLTLANLINYKRMDEQSYATMILSFVAITAISTPLVTLFSRNSKPYAPYGLRTIEHLKPGRGLRILTCIHTQDDVPSMINLLEASNASTESPVKAWNLNLLELIGRGIPALIFHDARRRTSIHMKPHIKQINKAFQQFERETGSWVSVESYTSISPYITMHQDICMLALDKKISLVILPFYKQQPIGNVREAVVDRTLKILNTNVLEEAPCSVGILVDHGLQRSFRANRSFYHVCVIFLGGADDREALSYGARMLAHPRVRLDVVRVLPKDPDEIDQRESLVDDKVVAMVRIKYTGNKNMIYREERVNNSEETISLIRSMGNRYNLVIVGKRHDSESILVKGLIQWCENLELGVIGDFITSSDYSKDGVSVLVMQQQINMGLVVIRGQQVLASEIVKTRPL